MPLHQKFSFFSSVQGFAVIEFDESSRILSFSNDFPFLNPSIETSNTDLTLSNFLIPGFFDYINYFIKSLCQGGVFNWFYVEPESEARFQCIMSSFVSKNKGDNGVFFTLGVKKALVEKSNEAILPLILNAVNSVDEGVAIADCAEFDNPIVFVNEKFCSISGYQVSEILGKNCRFLQGDLPSNVNARQAIKSAMSLSESVVVELDNVTAKGRAFKNSLSLSPVKDLRGMVTHYIGLQRDVTEQNRLLDQVYVMSEKYQALFYYAPVPLYVTDVNGFVVDCNLQFKNFMGDESASTVGKNHIEFFDVPSLKLLYGVDEGNFFTEFPPDLSMEFEVSKSANVKSWVVFRFIDLLRDLNFGNKTSGVDLGKGRFLCSFTGIELTKKNQLKQFFLIEKLRQSNFQLEHLAHMASHDLQVPLNKCCNYLYLLEESLDAEKVNRDYISKAINLCLDMKNLIKEVLVDAKPGSRFEDLASVELSVAVKNAIDLLEEIFDKSGAVVNLGPLPRVLGSITELTRVFQNLMSNAVKYRSSKSPQIDIYCQEGADGVAVFVDDNGMGIPENIRGSLFDFRTQASESSYGQGIGLSICTSIMNKHQGSISAAESKSGGSSFRLFFPKLESEI